MIQPTNLTPHVALTQQSSSPDSSIRGTSRPQGPAGVPAANNTATHADDWFAESIEISVSASRSQESVEAHTERVLSHLLCADLA